MSAKAQDIISAKDGEKIKAKVLEVTPTDVLYKLFKKQEGDTYDIPKSEVKKITYQDGRIEMYGKKKKQSVSDATPVQHKSNNTTGYISFNAGVGLPLGAFGSTNWDGNNSGYALSGITSSLDFGMPIAHSNFGVAGNVSYYQNGVDVNSLENNQEANANPPTHFTAYYNTTAGNYQAQTIMAGLYVTFPIHKFSIDFKALCGVAICTMPSVINTVTVSNYLYSAASGKPYQSATETENESAFTSYAFAYGGSITFRYAVVKHFCVMLQPNIFTSAPSFTPTVNSSNGSSTANAISQPFTIISVLAGIGVPF